MNKFKCLSRTAFGSTNLKIERLIRLYGLHVTCPCRQRPSDLPVEVDGKTLDAIRSRRRLAVVPSHAVPLQPWLWHRQPCQSHEQGWQLSSLSKAFKCRFGHQNVTFAIQNGLGGQRA